MTSRQQRSRDAKLAAGAKRVHVVIPPDMVPMLDAMRARHGSGEEALRRGLRLLAAQETHWFVDDSGAYWTLPEKGVE